MNFSLTSVSLVANGGGISLKITNFQGKGNLLKAQSESETSSAGCTEPRSPATDSVSPKPQRPLTLQVFDLAR